MAQIQDLQVQCEKDLMRVRIIFDRAFYGTVFSKGYVKQFPIQMSKTDSI